MVEKNDFLFPIHVKNIKNFIMWVENIEKYVLCAKMRFKNKLIVQWSSVDST